MKLNQAFLTIFGGVALSAMAFASSGNSKPVQLQDRVRHELLMLPYFNVFDDLSYKVEDGVITLTGQVTQPWLSRDAENAVRRIEGVERVNNQIEVLPLSPFDDRVRLATY